MHHTQETPRFSFEGLDVWHLTLEAIELADAIVRALPRGHGELADQLKRASLSVATNFAEGVGKDAADQRRYFRQARGSACETAALVEVAARLRLTSVERHAAIRQRLWRIVAILSKLSQKPA